MVTLAPLLTACGVLFGAAQPCTGEFNSNSFACDSQITILPTEVGILVTFATGEIQTLMPGQYSIDPATQEVTIYPTTRQSYTMAMLGEPAADDSIEAHTSDGQTVSIAVTVIYSIDPQKVKTVHLHWLNNYNENFIRPVSRAVVWDVVSGYTAIELFHNRSKIQVAIREKLSEYFIAKGFLLFDVFMRDVKFAPEFKTTLEAEALATLTPQPTNP
jgi:regulator of protease activity HflC (stomatin/prohibitin superfamily)